MVATQNNQGEVARPRTGKRIAGVALMILGVAVMAYGTHYLTVNGTCSSTGYVSFGPVPTCRGPEALYITSVFFLGPALALVGWLMAGVSGLMWPVFCLGMAVALITIRQETTVTAGAKAAGTLTGECFVVLAVISVIVTVRKRRNRKPAPASFAGSEIGPSGLAAPPGPSGLTVPLGPSGPAGPGTELVTSPPGTHRAGTPGTRTANEPEPDPLDTIAKLARLRGSGAITEEEYERQKAKLLSQI
jgi:hypothetical protein